MLIIRCCQSEHSAQDLHFIRIARMLSGILLFRIWVELPACQNPLVRKLYSADNSDIQSSSIHLCITYNRDLKQISFNTIDLDKTSMLTQSVHTNYDCVFATRNTHIPYRYLTKCQLPCN